MFTKLNYWSKMTEIVQENYKTSLKAGWIFRKVSEKC